MTRQSTGLEGAVITGENWRDNYKTPSYLLHLVNLFYGENWFDPCPVNPELDGLKVQWAQRNYINPPFSQYLQWVEKGLSEYETFTEKFIDVDSIPWMEQLWIMNHDSSTKRFKRIYEASSAICLSNHRVNFIDPRTDTPTTAQSQSQTLLYIGERVGEFTKCFRAFGMVARI